MGEKLSKTELSVYECIVSHKFSNGGHGPTAREIISHTDIKSTSTVSDVLRRLEAKGWIRLNLEAGSTSIVVNGARWLPPTLKPQLADKPERKYRYGNDRCANCAKPATNDKLRKGLCSACYSYKRIHHRNRPRKLWNQPFGYCDCGQPAVAILTTPHGDMPVCLSCLELERS